MSTNYAGILAVAHVGVLKNKGSFFGGPLSKDYSSFVVYKGEPSMFGKSDKYHGNASLW